MNEPIPDEKITELSALILSGNKIGAIKIYRKLTGTTLVEARNEIEKLEASLREEFPEKFSASSNATGCFGAVAVLCFSAVVLIFSILWT